MIIDFFSMSTMYANLSDIYYYDETGVKQSVTVKNTIESEYSVGDSVEKIEIPEILSFPLAKQEDGTYRISAYVDYDVRNISAESAGRRKSGERCLQQSKNKLEQSKRSNRI